LSINQGGQAGRRSKEIIRIMTVAQDIETKLTEAFQPVSLNIIDESSQHAGHVGARPEGETHFRVEIVAGAFADRNRVERQRMVYAVLADELAGPVHALSVSANAP
jgi:BolA protein